MTAEALVLVLGSANVDLATHVQRLPRAGETVMGGALDQTVGGKGANQAIAARRAGADIDFRAAIGRTDSGEWLVAQLRAEGVGVDHLERPAQPPGTAFVAIDAVGENQIVVCPGSNAQAGARLLEPSPRQPPAVVLVQCEIPRQTVLAALEYGRRIGAVTILNAAPATPLTARAVAAIDILVVNEHEYAIALGQPPGTQLTHQPGWPTVIVTLGARGAAILDHDETRTIPARPVTVVDTVGAGDAFCGVLAASLAHGHQIDEAVTWGCAAGALTVTRPGAATALPTADEIHRFRTA